jgi:surfactin synthase thioesterase subunit
VGIQLPGREERVREAPSSDYRNLVAPIADAIAHLERKPTILLGYSMGALLAFETARALETSPDLLRPSALIVAACGAPARNVPAAELSSDSDLVAHLQRMGGAAAELTEHAALWKVVRPALRADLSVIGKYQLQGSAILNCPIVAIGGSDDLTCSAEDIAAWRQATRSSCAVEIVPGGHFFINEDASGFFSTLNRHLRALLGAAASDAS